MGGPHPERDAGKTCKDCGAAPTPGERRCKGCKTAHNAREAARRKARKRKGLCRVCGAPGARSEAGETLSTCPRHREYYAARQRA